jgi:microcystin-dependent protein
MSEPFLGEIKLFSFGFAPKGWALCNGQLLPINQNQALFSILGTTYGGDGRTTFALPNLQGRTPFHAGNGFTLGQNGGEQAHTLNINEMPGHTHPAVASANSANQASPVYYFWAVSQTYTSYASSVNETMAPQAVGVVGGQPHENLSPFLVLNFCIALQGIFPSRN